MHATDSASVSIIERDEAQERRRAAPGEIAWLLAIPCAVVAVTAMILLGGTLGRLLFTSHARATFFPELLSVVVPKPAETARYLIALAAAMLLAVTTVGMATNPPQIKVRTIKILLAVSQCVAVTFLLVCLWVQHTFVYGIVYSTPEPFQQPYFTIPTLVVGACLAAALAFAVKNETARTRLTAILHRSHRGVAVLAIALAAMLTAAWVLSGVNSDSTIGNSDVAVLYHLQFTIDEAFAVLNGRTPLVNFVPQYGALWPYVTALAMWAFGTSLGVFSVAMCAITGISLLAIFGALRRVTGSALAALLLYLPVLASSLFRMHGNLVNRYGPVTYYATFPLRYAGPYLLVWLLTRHLDGARPRRRWLVFFFGGLVVINNTDFGLAAFGATFAAMLWVSTPLSWTGVARLSRAAVCGALAACAFICAVTLLRAGSLPRVSSLFHFAAIFGVDGFGLLPTPTLGLHVIIYLTYVAAIATATVRAIHRGPGSLLTALLVWSGIFGLGAGSYYMGRSHPEDLVSMFSAWAFALALLTVAVIEEVTRHPERRLTIAYIAVFASFGVAACSFAQTPLPWTQIERLEKHATPYYKTPSVLSRGLALYSEGKPVEILSTLGYRIAYESGTTNIAPYAGTQSLFTYAALNEALHALRVAGGGLLVLPEEAYTSIIKVVCKRGFSYLGTVYARHTPPQLTSNYTFWAPPWIPLATRRRCVLGGP